MAGGSFKRRHAGPPRAVPSRSVCRRERRRHWENIHSNRGCERREARRCAAVVRQRALLQPARRVPRLLRSARESPVSDEWPRPSAGQNGEPGDAERLLAQREQAAGARKRRTRGRAFALPLLFSPSFPRLWLAGGGGGVRSLGSIWLRRRPCPARREGKMHKGEASSLRNINILGLVGNPRLLALASLQSRLLLLPPCCA